MSLLGEAIETVCNPWRINYEILRNTDEFLHAQVALRYEWEDEKYIGYPRWKYIWEAWNVWNAPENQWSNEKYGSVRGVEGRARITHG